MNRSRPAIAFLLVIGWTCTSSILAENSHPLYARGRIFIQGEGIECKEVTLSSIVASATANKHQLSAPIELCNTTWVMVEIEGISLSIKARKGSTPASIAVELAKRINSHPELSTLVAAEVSGNEVHITAREPGVKQSYPWSSSCTPTKGFFDECGFRLLLSPIATLAPAPGEPPK